MSKIKFTAKVNHGKIESTQEHQEEIQTAETIEIIINRQTISSNQSIIYRWLNNPFEIQIFVPLTRDEVHESN
ncbi:MAG: hypothetical protein QNJ55_36540 [Xenococcus sp. MO_188.B8]|nr:hypothetical protein [Xenococcus sp. MO_188.B8]